MTVWIGKILILAISYILLKGSKQSGRVVFKQCSMKMCREMCYASTGVFNFNKSDHSCHQIPSNDTNSKDNRSNGELVICTKSKQRQNGTMVVVKGRISCELSPSDWKMQPQLTTRTLLPEDPGLIPQSCKTTLHQACEDGRVCMVHFILGNGIVDINCRGKKGRTPVMAAVIWGQLEVLEFLIKSGCNLTSTDDYKDSVLHLACAAGSVEIVRKILDTGKLAVDRVGRYGLIPITTAVIHDHKEVFNLLLSRGCDPRTVYKNNNILHLASYCGHVSMVKRILDLDIVWIDSRGNFMETAVMKAAKRGKNKVVELLVKKGCNVTSVNEEGDNILHLACQHGRMKTVEYILRENLIDIDSAFIQGRTPVMRAAAFGQTSLVKYLHKEGCNLSVVDVYGNSLIHMACISRNVALVEYIITQNISDLEKRGLAGRTPVMTAAVKGSRQVFVLLRKYGCNMTAVDFRGNNVLHLACLYGQLSIVKYIVEQQIIDKESRGHLGRTPVMFTIISGQKIVFDFLAGAGCDLKAVDDNQDNLLHLACLSEQTVTVKLILSQDILGKESRGFAGRTPVMIAVLTGNTEIFALLKEKGCNLSAADYHGDNLLHLACKGGHIEMVKNILKLKAASLKNTNKYGRTPIQEAKINEHARIVDLLKNVAK